MHASTARACLRRLSEAVNSVRRRQASVREREFTVHSLQFTGGHVAIGFHGGAREIKSVSHRTPRTREGHEEKRPVLTAKCQVPVLKKVNRRSGPNPIPVFSVVSPVFLGPFVERYRVFLLKIP